MRHWQASFQINSLSLSPGSFCENCNFTSQTEVCLYLPSIASFFLFAFPGEPFLPSSQSTLLDRAAVPWLRVGAVGVGGSGTSVVMWLKSMYFIFLTTMIGLGMGTWPRMAQWEPSLRLMIEFLGKRLSFSVGVCSHWGAAQECSHLYAKERWTEKVS